MWSNAWTQAGSRSLSALFAVLSVSAAAAHAQSIATLKGRITDASGAVVRGAMVTVRDEDTGGQHSGTSDAAGEYHFAFLAVGTYRIEAHAPGFRSEVLPNLAIEVGRTIVRDFQLRIGDATETVEVASEVPLIERSMTLGQVVDRRTVQAIPLNGRQLLQLALLAPGSVTPPQNGFLTSPSRAQGSQGINTAGHREDTANIQVNGVTLNDQVNNILVFQPPLDSVQEFRIDNSSPAAEHGRSSGASINIVTRSGANPWHGGVSEFFRNERLDARNLFSHDQAPFDRHQFGAQLGGPIVRNRTFFFATYEGIRQQQGLPVNSVVLSDGQRAAVTDPVIDQLVALVPRATMTDERGTARFVGWADAQVDVDRLAGDVTHQFDSADRLHGFYAFQRDWRQEPLELGNTLPGFGDVRRGHRQLLTLEHTRTIGSRVVNQARVGFNRIAFEARPGASAQPADYRLETPASAPGLPVFNVAGAFNFGGPANMPQGRTDTTVLVSDTVSYVAGRHAIKVGAEYRRSTITSWMLDAGTFNFSTVAAFAAGTANAFSVVVGDRAADISQNALGGFVQDSFRAHPTLTFDAGLRYEWNVTPTERADRFIVFDAPTASLEPVGVHRAAVYEQNNHNVEPRVGVAWNPARDGRTLIRAAYAFTVEQPMVNAVLNLTANPPLNTPLTVTGAVPVGSAYALAAAGGLAPITVEPRYENGVTHGWNVNLQREVARGLAVMAGYVGARGIQLRLTRNLNQPLDGLRPYRTLSTLSPILPGTPLGNITQVESSGSSKYQALWASFSRRLSRGLQFGASYTWSRSFDSNSLSSPPTTVTVQNGYDIEDSWGPSDFDARHRFVLHAFYELPFGAGPLLRGWQLAAILQTQSGNPVNLVTNNSSLTGVANTVRPDVTGPIRIVGDVNPWFDTSVFVPVNGFGNLGRNAVVGPRFDALDMSVSKTIPLTTTLRAQLQVEVFNVLNHPNLGQPGRIVGTPNFGVITNTRFPPGDSGSSRQIQLAIKVSF